MFRINDAWDIVAGVFLLVLVYLLISRAKEVNNIIGTLASNSVRGIVVLQGRSPKTVGV